MYSSDGITWRSGNSMYGNWIKLMWIKELNLFCSVANTFGSNSNKIVAYSYDGMNWFYVNYVNVTTQFSDACWAPELGILCAVETTGFYYVNNPLYNNAGLQIHGVNKGLQLSRLNTVQKNKLYWPSKGLMVYDTTQDNISYWDGKNWVGQHQKSLFLMNNTDTPSFIPISNWYTASSASDNNWSSVCWSTTLNIFCAVAYSGTGNRVMTSPDGINWTSRTSAADNEWRSVCWSPYLNMFCAVASSGTNRAMTSPDGITWTARSTTHNYDWQCVIWAANLNRFVAVSSTGATSHVITSTNGTTWTLVQTSLLPYTYIINVPELSRMVTLAPTNTGASAGFLSNTFGSVGSFTTNSNEWVSVVWSPELKILCAVSRTGTNNRVMTSIDSTTWVTRSTPVDNNWQSIVWSPEFKLFCAVANSGTGNRIMTSPDGINWTAKTSPADNNWSCVCWSPALNMFVSVADSGTGNRVMYSSSALPKSNSAILDIYSTNQGFLPPRMTTTQKSNITTPAEGLNVYDSTNKSMSYYNGTQWIDTQPSLWSSPNTTLTITATTTNPTKGPTAVDFIIYKKISNDNEYEIISKFVQTTSGTSGSGDYLFALPGGLKFSNDYGQERYTTITASYDAYRYILPKCSGRIVLGTGSAVNDIAVIPYDDTTFRLFTTNNGTNPLTAIRSATYGLGNTAVPITYIFNFTFFAQ
jgi:hypothetical protein